MENTPLRIMLDGSFAGNAQTLEEARQIVYSFIAKLPLDKRYKKYQIYDSRNNLVGSGSTS